MVKKADATIASSGLEGVYAAEKALNYAPARSRLRRSTRFLSLYFFSIFRALPERWRKSTKREKKGIKPRSGGNSSKKKAEAVGIEQPLSEKNGIVFLQNVTWRVRFLSHPLGREL